jgi:hypothetical protein
VSRFDRLEHCGNLFEHGIALVLHAQQALAARHVAQGERTLVARALDSGSAALVCFARSLGALSVQLGARGFERSDAHVVVGHGEFGVGAQEKLDQLHAIVERQLRCTSLKAQQLHSAIHCVWCHVGQHSVEIALEPNALDNRLDAAERRLLQLCHQIVGH